MRELFRSRLLYASNGRAKKGGGDSQRVFIYLGDKMKIAVLFDGAGLARLGLEKAGHSCTGYEIDPAKHYLSQMVGSGNSILADVRDVDLSGYDMVWASPPCQERSNQKHAAKNLENASLLSWTLKLKSDVLWVENVIANDQDNSFGTFYNAAQFLELPIQRRRRIVAGRYKTPCTWRDYKYNYPEWKYYAPPAVMACEMYNGGINKNPENERRKFTRWYMKYKGRVPTLFDMAYHQGFDMPLKWLAPPDWWKSTQREWLKVISSALGSAVPCYMAYAFGAVYSDVPVDAPKQLALFA